MGDWSELIPDLLIMIARRIKSVEDFMAFRGVCTSWRAAGIESNYVNSCPTIPLLMVGEEEDSEDRQFYSVYRGRIWRTLSLPEAKGKICFETRGWLLLWDRMSGELSLLHPISRAQIELPHQTTFPEFEEGIYKYPGYHSIYKAVLSANPSDTTKFVLVVIYSCHINMLGFWTPGNNSWGSIETSCPKGGRYVIGDANFYDGKLYAMAYMGYIWVWDISGPDPAVAQYLFRINSKLIFPRVFHYKAGANIGLYLVESSSSLLIVARGLPYIRDDHETCGAADSRLIPDFRVIQPDFSRCVWEEITNLAERAIFVGHNGAFCVDATSFPGVIKPNCIYFIGDQMDGVYFIGGGRMGAINWRRRLRQSGKNRMGMMGVYNFDDRKIERFVRVQSSRLTCPPILVTPSLM